VPARPCAAKRTPSRSNAQGAAPALR
jgi:hypothetical protein